MSFTVRGVSMSASRALLRSVTSVLKYHTDSLFGSFVGHKTLKPSESPCMHLTLPLFIPTAHPVTDMVKLFEDNGIYVMAKRFANNIFRNVMQIIFGEAVFSLFQSYENTPGTASAFCLKFTLGSKDAITLPVVETRIEELTGGGDGNTVYSEIDSHHDTGIPIENRTTDGDVEKELSIPVIERGRSVLIIGIIKMFSLVISKDVCGLNTFPYVGQRAATIPDGHSTLVIKDGTKFSEDRFPRLATLSEFRHAGFRHLSHTIPTLFRLIHIPIV